MTKYGPRRVRVEPPTLEDALFAAEGMTDDAREQLQIAAALMQLPVDQVRLDAQRLTRAGRPRTVQGRNSSVAVVVQRKPARRVLRAAPR
jgi:hypothetical protein